MTTTAKVHAVYKHNCAKCRWLGTIPHQRVETNACDLYLCSASGMLVARYADAPPEVGAPDNIMSLKPDDVLERDLPELIVALDMAIMWGHLNDDGDLTADLTSDLTVE